MEALGAEGQWTSLSGVYTAEEADFMALLLSNQISSSVATTWQNFWPDHDHQSSTNYHMPNNYNPNNTAHNTFSRGSTTSPRTNYTNNTNNNNNSSSFNVFPTSSNDLSDQNSQPASIDFFVGDLKPTTTNIHNPLPVQGDHCDDIGLSAPKGIKKSESSAALEEHNKGSSSAGKRPRSSQNVEAVGKKQGKSKKKPKLVLSIPDRRNNGVEEGDGFGANGLSSSSTCCSGDESINGGQDLSGGESLSLSPTEPSDGKRRARRGSATDPQSLYARKRRERINERLRTLQNLVPNGTKVDISTMLEEAVQYVKFLQLQIKLLSSDEMWMYAPIAYNGKELELDHHLKLSLANNRN